MLEKKERQGGDEEVQELDLHLFGGKKCAYPLPDQQ